MLAIQARVVVASQPQECNGDTQFAQFTLRIEDRFHSNAEKEKLLTKIDRAAIAGAAADRSEGQHARGMKHDAGATPYFTFE